MGYWSNIYHIGRSSVLFSWKTPIKILQISWSTGKRDGPQTLWFIDGLSRFLHRNSNFEFLHPSSASYFTDLPFHDWYNFQFITWSTELLLNENLNKSYKQQQQQWYLYPSNSKRLIVELLVTCQLRTTKRLKVKSDTIENDQMLSSKQSALNSFLITLWFVRLNVSCCHCNLTAVRIFHLQWHHLSQILL